MQTWIPADLGAKFNMKRAGFRVYIRLD